MWGASDAIGGNRIICTAAAASAATHMSKYVVPYVEFEEKHSTGLFVMLQADIILDV
jgi:hypothetical protein